MTDYFALLDIERRPSIPQEFLENAYFRKTESLRLDQAQEEAFSSLNMAFRVVSDPATRVQHLLKLEFGDARGGEMGVDFGDLFGEIADTLQNADQEFGSVSAESSALLRALAFQRMDGVRDKLRTVEDELTQRERSLLSELEQLNSSWLENPAQCRKSLAQIALSLTFLQKWLGEVRERKIRLEELA